MVVEALRATFDEAYPTAQFRGVLASVDYPATAASYPCIFVEFETSSLQTAGIDHKEIAVDDTSHERMVRRWRFSGRLMFTCGAMTTATRDLLADELVKVLASGMENPARARFRQMFETNDLVGLQANWDQIDLGAPVAAPGTPWGTDDLICERTATLTVQGEFISDLSQDLGVLVPLSAVRIYHAPVGQPPVNEAGQQPAAGGGWV